MNMQSFEVLYQRVEEATIIIEARDEEHLADIMEEGNFDLDFKEIYFYSEILNYTEEQDEFYSSIVP